MDLYGRGALEYWHQGIKIQSIQKAYEKTILEQWRIRQTSQSNAEISRNHTLISELVSNMGLVINRNRTRLKNKTWVIIK